jgi:hypothetical protein
MRIRQSSDMYTRPDLLAAYPFVGALAVLLLNDFVLKEAWGNLITGKLSDFAGLFVFPLFWTAVLPRYRTLVHCGTGALFVWWKLPVSEPLIASWNSWAPLTVGRTADVSDLLALTSVACAYHFSSASRRQIPLPAVRWAIVPIALFAFAATSFWSVRRYERTYLFRANPAEVRQGMHLLGMREVIASDSTAAPVQAPDGGGQLVLRIPTATGFSVSAGLYMTADSVGTAITLRELHYGMPPARGDSIIMIDFFERCFVQRLDSLLTGGRHIRPSAVSYPVEAVSRSTWCER